ncbi:M56 family metallopeptidase [Actinoplanes sp. KI2]|uniref:M56 family metallopeptidase n=1 Tax=Actinoplanes sp. KI2 TaxID=2983315 RepID=UPI0021D5E408|nr:M56 family metallopeptidase [Actinoplanes sp. KI2]MCU7724339.1 M56 family metallopeptidase [Actinoplanes sp. KI2]
MTVSVYLPLVLALPLALLAPRVAARGRPGPAAWALTAAAVVAALASTWSLALLALTMLDDVPPLAALDENPALALPEPVPGPVALLAGLLLTAGGARLAVDAHRRIGTNRRLRAIGEPEHDLVVADWSAPIAVAVPGSRRRPGHLLVTSGILRSLSPDERRVVFAHERAHLAHRHHRLTAAAGAAAAVNPLLIPVRAAVEFLAERWADEDAAAEVGDRGLAARAVARAALATSGPGAGPVLGIDGGAAVQRVRALTRPAPAPLLRHLAGPLLPAAFSVAVAATATKEFVDLARAWL